MNNPSTQKRMSTYNNIDDTVQEDDAQWTDIKVEEDTSAQEQPEPEPEAEKSSPDLTLPVEQVVRTKRTSMELSQWRADMTRPEHTTNGTMKQKLFFFFFFPSFLSSFLPSFLSSICPFICPSILPPFLFVLRPELVCAWVMGFEFSRAE